MILSSRRSKLALSSSIRNTSRESSKTTNKVILMLKKSIPYKDPTWKNQSRMKDESSQRTLTHIEKATIR